MTLIPQPRHSFKTTTFYYSTFQDPCCSTQSMRSWCQTSLGVLHSVSPVYSSSVSAFHAAGRSQVKTSQATISSKMKMVHLFKLIKLQSLKGCWWKIKKNEYRNVQSKKRNLECFSNDNLCINVNVSMNGFTMVQVFSMIFWENNNSLWINVGTIKGFQSN